MSEHLFALYDSKMPKAVAKVNWQTQDDNHAKTLREKFGKTESFIDGYKQAFYAEIGNEINSLYFTAAILAFLEYQSMMPDGKVDREINIPAFRRVVGLDGKNENSIDKAIMKATKITPDNIEGMTLIYTNLTRYFNYILNHTLDRIEAGKEITESTSASASSSYSEDQSEGITQSEFRYLENEEDE